MGRAHTKPGFILLALTGAALILIAGIALYKGWASQAAFEVQTSQTAKSARNHANTQLARYCAPLPNEAESNCRREVEDSYRDYYKESRDLEAQRVTAMWTALMGSAALVGMVFSIIGVGLVFATFQQTLKQAAEIKESVASAGRSATAMEGVAVSMAINAEQVVRSVGISADIADQQRIFGRMQMRAYVSVLIGGGLYQTKDVRFEVRPQIVNNGNTPARNVRWRIAADVLPVPLPEDFRFPLPSKMFGGSVLGAHQDAFMSVIVPERVDEAVEEDVRMGIGKSVYIWGYLSYEDAFARTHRCTFAQQVYWLQTGEADKNGLFPASLRGYYLARHNCAN